MVNSFLFSFNAHHSKINSILSVVADSEHVKAQCIISCDENGKVIRWGVQHNGVELRQIYSNTAPVASVALEPSGAPLDVKERQVYVIKGEINGNECLLAKCSWLQMFGQSGYGEFWTAPLHKHSLHHIDKVSGVPIPISSKVSRSVFEDAPLSMDIECLSSSRKPTGFVSLVEEELYSASSPSGGDSVAPPSQLLARQRESSGRASSASIALSGTQASSMDARPSTTTAAALVHRYRGVLPPKPIVVTRSEQLESLRRPNITERPSTSKQTLNFGSSPTRGDPVTTDVDDLEIEWKTTSKARYAIKLAKNVRSSTAPMESRSKAPQVKVVQVSTPAKAVAKVNGSPLLGSPLQGSPVHRIPSPVLAQSSISSHEELNFTENVASFSTISAASVEGASEANSSRVQSSGATLPKSFNSTTFRPSTSCDTTKPMVISRKRPASMSRRRFNVDRAMYSSTGIAGVDAVGFAHPLCYGAERKKASGNRWNRADTSIAAKRAKVNSTKVWEKLELGTVSCTVSETDGILMLDCTGDGSKPAANLNHQQHSQLDGDYSDVASSVEIKLDDTMKEALDEFAALAGILVEENEQHDGDEEVASNCHREFQGTNDGGNDEKGANPKKDKSVNDSDQAAVQLDTPKSGMFQEPEEKDRQISPTSPSSADGNAENFPAASPPSSRFQSQRHCAERRRQICCCCV